MPEAADRPLPAGLDLLWGRRAPGQRGPKPTLSVDQIVMAAITVADAEGLAALSMARVAKELGFTTMSLYRHVASKEQLLQLMFDASATGAEDLVLEGDTWRERMRHWAVTQRDMLDRHPWVTELPMALPPLAPNSLTFVERGLAALDGTGLSNERRMRMIGLLSSYTLSEARMAQDAIRAARQAATEREQAGDSGPPAWTFEELLRELVVDRERFPHLYEIAWTQPVAPDGTARQANEREEFEFGLERILDAIEVLIQVRGTSPPPGRPG